MRNSNKIITGLIVLCCLSSIIVEAAENLDDLDVTLDFARQIAANFVYFHTKSQLIGSDEWKDAALSEPVLYYDLNGNVKAYCFSVVKNDQDFGYLILSSKKSSPPIMEFSLKPAPHKRTFPILKQAAQKYILANKLDKKIGAPFFIYLCPSKYLVQFPLIDKTNPQSFNESIYVDMRSAVIVRNVKTEVYTVQHRSKQTIVPWNILQNINALTEQTKIVFALLKDVQAYPYLRSTHSIAVAGLLNYLGMKDKKLPLKAFIAGITTYIEKCLCDLPEKPIIWKIGKGIKEFSVYQGYRIEIDEKCRYSANTEEEIQFADLKIKINKTYPVIVTFLYEPHYHHDLETARQRITGSSVIGTGYLEYQIGQYLAGLDGLFKDEELLIDKKNLATETRNTVTFYNWDGDYSNLIIVSVLKLTKMNGIETKIE
ncbi:MAG: hypothetical protein ABH952_07515 [Candidatus Omnitrophota bacterium]